MYSPTTEWVRKQNTHFLCIIFTSRNCPSVKIVLCLLFLPERGKPGQVGMRGGGRRWWEWGCETDRGSGTPQPRDKKGNGLGAYNLVLLLVWRYSRRFSLVVSGGKLELAEDSSGLESALDADYFNFDLNTLLSKPVTNSVGGCFLWLFIKFWQNESRKEWSDNEKDLLLDTEHLWALSIQDAILKCLKSSIFK